MRMRGPGRQGQLRLIADDVARRTVEENPVRQIRQGGLAVDIRANEVPLDPIATRDVPRDLDPICMLPETRLPSPSPVPPTLLSPELRIRMPSPPFGIAMVPFAFVPIRLALISFSVTAPP